MRALSERRQTWGDRAWPGPATSRSVAQGSGCLCYCVSTDGSSRSEQPCSRDLRFVASEEPERPLLRLSFCRLSRLSQRMVPPARIEHAILRAFEFGISSGSRPSMWARRQRETPPWETTTECTPVTICRPSRRRGRRDRRSFRRHRGASGTGPAGAFARPAGSLAAHVVLKHAFPGAVVTAPSGEGRCRSRRGRGPARRARSPSSRGRGRAGSRRRRACAMVGQEGAQARRRCGAPARGPCRSAECRAGPGSAGRAFQSVSPWRTK